MKTISLKLDEDTTIAVKLSADRQTQGNASKWIKEAIEQRLRQEQGLTTPDLTDRFTSLENLLMRGVSDRLASKMVGIDNRLDEQSQAVRKLAEAITKFVR